MIARTLAFTTVLAAPLALWSGAECYRAIPAYVAATDAERATIPAFRALAAFESLTGCLVVAEFAPVRGRLSLDCGE